MKFNLTSSRPVTTPVLGCPVRRNEPKRPHSVVFATVARGETAKKRSVFLERITNRSQITTNLNSKQTTIKSPWVNLLLSQTNP